LIGPIESAPKVQPYVIPKYTNEKNSMKTLMGEVDDQIDSQIGTSMNSQQ